MCDEQDEDGKVGRGFASTDSRMLNRTLAQNLLIPSQLVSIEFGIYLVFHSKISSPVRS
jgi:hypothetical protein